MIDKYTEFATKTDKGVFLFTIGEGRDGAFLEKTASAEYHPEVAKYIADARPIPGHTQVLLTALGAGEYWGENKNGDFFPEGPLKNPTPEYGYKTFEHLARVHKHHVNKPDSPSYGRVVLSVWNEKMKRVELIIMLEHAVASDLVERINNGEYPSVSMGCKVPFDVCSLCGNQAKQRADYCDHLRYYMKKIPPGFTKKAVALNTRPRFFDISFVFVGADSIARVLKKVASYGDHSEKIAARKHAQIEKEVPGNIEPEVIKNLDDGVEMMRDLEPEFPRSTIISIGNSSAPGMENVNRILSTLAYMGIAPKPQEFQSIVLRALGKSDLADEYEENGITFNPDTHLSKENQCQCEKMIDIRPGNFDDRVFDLAAPFAQHKSYATPIMHKRIILITKLANEGKLRYPLEKHASEDSHPKVGLLPMMAILAGLQMAFGKKIPESQLTGIDKVLLDKGKLALLLAGTVGGAMALPSLFSRTPTGRMDTFPGKDTVQAPDPSRWREELAHRAETPIMKVAGYKTILFGVPAVYALSGIQKVKHERNPYEPENFAMKFLRKHPEMASIGLVGGKKLVEKGLSSPTIRKMMPMLGKKASFKGDVGSQLLAAVAFPSASLANRAAAWTIDQSVLSGLGGLGALKQKLKKGGVNANNR